MKFSKVIVGKVGKLEKSYVNENIVDAASQAVWDNIGSTDLNTYEKLIELSPDELVCIFCEDHSVLQNHAQYKIIAEHFSAVFRETSRQELLGVASKFTT